MSEENNEDDSWLYGNSNENQDNQEEQPQYDEKTITDEQSASAFSNDTTQDNSKNDELMLNVSNEFNQEDNFMADTSIDGEKVNGNSDVNGAVSEKNENDDEDSDEDDDDVVVTIRNITKTDGFKQRSGNLLAPTSIAGQDKPKANLGKFSIEEFESVGTISGQSAVEYNIEAIEDKPWRKPGADITDYFNYGFNEETWRAYCERQKRMRHESGAGLSGLGPNPPQTTPVNSNANRTLTSLTTSDSNKFSAPGSTNSHSGPPNFSNRGFNVPPVPAKENVIQVMTAERREYSRPKGKFEVIPPPPFNMSNEPFYPEDNYNSYGYEPTQEQQWNNDNVGVGWMPSGIKELTPGPMMPLPPMNMSMPPPPNAMMPPNMMSVPPQMVPPPQHNMNMGIGPPGMPPMMPPPVINSTMPPNRGNEDHRNNQQMDKRNDSTPPAWRRDKEREYRDRDREEESPSERERRRERERYRSDRDRGGSSRRDRSRSRERSRRRSKSRSRERERKSRDKKKSHKKDKDDSE